MTITAITPSPEPCTEAGWHAAQWHLDRKLSRELVTALRPLGSLLLLDALAQPFFKIESHHYMVKGILGDTSLRVAVHRDHEAETQRIIQLIQQHHA